MRRAIIVGAGLAGLTAAIRLAELGIESDLVSVQPSERAQSVLAAGGINAALDTMGEQDTVQDHRDDTLRAGVYLADPEAVEGLTRQAPQIVLWLKQHGVPFNQNDGRLIQRSFGGQKKRRTAFAKSSTGKMIMTVLIDEARKYEAKGIIHRYPHHEFACLAIAREGTHRRCIGAAFQDTFTGRMLTLSGSVILCCGGLNGMFPGLTTGTTANTGDAAAQVFAQGVPMSNLEMIQYHPTTIGISGKHCLVSEAARGEGGRLFILRGGQPWYFMEEKYPELGNLMPRDVVSREMFFALRDEHCGDQVYLDMTGLSQKVWQDRLPDLRKEIQDYLNIDPVKNPVPVTPAIHYFMGGIDVDVHHRTHLAGLYAAGECCSQYHGANRLGGNSMLGAIYGGRTAAETLAGQDQTDEKSNAEDVDMSAASPKLIEQVSQILQDSMGIVRNGAALQDAQQKLEDLSRAPLNRRERNRVQLALAMVESAAYRRESRGAHYREDYPASDESCRRMTLSAMGEGICIEYQTKG